MGEDFEQAGNLAAALLVPDGGGDGDVDVAELDGIYLITKIKLLENIIERH